jgi:hypothetical protein
MLWVKTCYAFIAAVALEPWSQTLQHLADVPRYWVIALRVAVKPEARCSGRVAVHRHLLPGYLVPALRQHWQRETETTV